MFSVCLLVNVSNFEVSGIPGKGTLGLCPPRPQRKPAFEKLPGMTHLDISHHQPKHDRRHVCHIQSMISVYFTHLTISTCTHLANLALPCQEKNMSCLPTTQSPANPAGGLLTVAMPHDFAISARIPDGEIRRLNPGTTSRRFQPGQRATGRSPVRCVPNKIGL